jgi:hypothetical protein
MVREKIKRKLRGQCCRNCKMNPSLPIKPSFNLYNFKKYPNSARRLRVYCSKHDHLKKETEWCRFYEPTTKES